LDINNIYTNENDVVAAAHTEYTTSSLPFFLIEARYEGEGANEAVVRRKRIKRYYQVHAANYSATNQSGRL